MVIVNIVIPSPFDAPGGVASLSRPDLRNASSGPQDGGCESRRLCLARLGRKVDEIRVVDFFLAQVGLLLLLLLLLLRGRKILELLLRRGIILEW